MRQIKVGDVFSSKALETYESCWDLGFNQNQKVKGSYACQKPLYNDKSLHGDGSVWMICWTKKESKGFFHERKGSYLSVHNTISTDWKKIEERYDKRIPKEKRKKRIVFAKRKDGKTNGKFKYVFLGVYKGTPSKKDKKTYIFTRTSTKFPVQKI